MVTAGMNNGTNCVTFKYLATYYTEMALVIIWQLTNCWMMLQLMISKKRCETIESNVKIMVNFVEEEKRDL